MARHLIAYDSAQTAAQQQQQLLCKGLPFMLDLVSSRSLVARLVPAQVLCSVRHIWPRLHASWSQLMHFSDSDTEG